ncbi:hypothetical protein THAOC_06904 [Thalassiosira oceanica]|uniref:Phosphofructokinase domain-containing protein n=1 Tax=Thalassiosira oceanica TaxID=159749 RepID=K0SZ25_THAOC|nr:hypothetical protein THAOC_06904 [Thalassiosira oceanica]|eukprot:EJK71633.1 hypothetical protein THAOC_06904 [Thalassiosira oceanica]
MGSKSMYLLRNSAMHSALGSCVVDLCLVPEVDFFLDGPGGIVDHLYERIRANDKAVVVVAEGAGQKLMAAMGAAGETVTDASGNILLDDIGPWLCRQLKTRLDPRLEEASDHGDKLTLKYLDPSYSVRGIPPLTADNLYCLQLAHNAVHGAMAGMTNFLVGAINTRECYIPIPLVADKRNVIDTRHQSLWETLVFATGQPSFQREGDDAEDFDALTTASGGVLESSIISESSLTFSKYPTLNSVSMVPKDGKSGRQRSGRRVRCRLVDAHDTVQYACITSGVENEDVSAAKLQPSDLCHRWRFDCEVRRLAQTGKINQTAVSAVVHMSAQELEQCAREARVVKDTHGGKLPLGAS